jgi:septal ring factor EnvC (AmiA/AmiB activator)
MTLAGSRDEHERFKELSALANAGALGSAELTELHRHLQSCGNCREVHDQYRLLSRVGIPELAAIHRTGQEEAEWDDTATRRKLLARIRKEDGNKKRISPDALPVLFGLRNRYAAFAVAVLATCCALLMLGAAYQVGRRMQSGTKHVAASENRLPVLAAERKSVQDQLGNQADQILHLQEKNYQSEQELAKLRLALRTMTDRANDSGAAKNRTDEQLRMVLEQRDALSVQLREVEQANQNIQAELASLRAERDKALLRMVSLESKIDELTATTRVQERKIKDDEQYLASDRDIRELMGARGLYIADVYDVDSRSRTRKSFGRVFYTQGKSLIFYAFDLDPGVTNANAFQVWGRKETAKGTQARPKSLGILYLDSESNRRWVMRFDDARQLEEIDAVFVTVEPHGGSPKPTSKPFLYALLRQEVNHP